MVREVEYRLVRISLAIALVVLLGLGFGIVSFFAESNAVSGVFGIIGITFLWDGLEFYRQQKRVKKGHAPANPDNPRHQHILTHYPQATTVGLVDRDPRGYPYNKDEILLILKDVENLEGDHHK